MMWMMGYDDGAAGEDPFTARKLRPLMPRPAATSPPLFSRIHTHDLVALNHHLATAEQMSKREVSGQHVVVSSRWNPTPEQLHTLEDLYRRGTRTPSADQIQQITAQLRRYGKIEGKNVFYWFQNHKARERQKRRRHLIDTSDHEQQQNPNNNSNSNQAEKRDSPQDCAGANRTLFQVENKGKNWASLTNSSTIPEKTTQRAAKAAAETECKSDGWEQFNIEADAGSQQRRNATWQLSSKPPSTIELLKMPPQQNFVNIFLEPYINPNQQEAQTLQLFPIQAQHEDDDDSNNSVTAANRNVNVTPNCQFFEFLPLKGS